MAEYEQLQEISSSLERGEIDGGRYLEQFTRFLAGHIGCSRATVRVFIDTPAGRALRSIAMYDAIQNRMIAAQDLLRADTGPYFDRLLHDGCVVVSETRTDPIVAPFRKAYLEPDDIRSVMDMCFAVNGELFGTFSCEQLNQPLGPEVPRIHQRLNPGTAHADEGEFGRHKETVRKDQKKHQQDVTDCQHIVDCDLNG